MPNKKLKGNLRRDSLFEMRGTLLAICFEGLKLDDTVLKLLFIFVAASLLRLRMGLGKKSEKRTEHKWESNF